MNIQIIKQKISKAALDTIAKEQFVDFVKAVVDAELGVMAIGGELHADEEAVLLEHSSRQQDLWGINLYPKIPTEEWIEFDSMINVRPSQGNRSRNVESPDMRKKIRAIVQTLVSS